MPTALQWITGESDVNTEKTRSKRAETNRSAKKLKKEYKKNKGSNRGYGINKK